MIESERKHTPLPWKAGSDVGGAIGIRSGDGPPVAVVRYSDNPAISQEAARANADLIELACNSHYDQLDVLYEVEWCINGTECPVCSGGATSGHVDNCSLATAIAKATP